jgi:DNA-binding transcriptional LysR family regulator
MEALRLTLRQLQVFASVARLGSTTAAAPVLSLSQSATSSAVNELERLLGLRVFDRAGRHLRLNEHGRALLPRALRVLDTASGIERLGADAQGLLQNLRIGASTTVGNYLLPAILADYFGRSTGRDESFAGDSEWRSQVVIANTEVICRQLANFDLDVGLIEGRCSEPSLKITNWRQDEMVVVATCPRSGASARGKALRPCALDMDQLRSATWLLREEGSGTRQSTDQLLLPHLGEYRRSIVLGSSEAIKHGVAAGLGIACLSRWVVADMLAGGVLQLIRAPLPVLYRQCHVVLHQDKESTPALERFLELARLHGASQPTPAPPIALS